MKYIPWMINKYPFTFLYRLHKGICFPFKRTSSEIAILQNSITDQNFLCRFKTLGTLPHFIIQGNGMEFAHLQEIHIFLKT